MNVLDGRGRNTLDVSVVSGQLISIFKDSSVVVMIFLMSYCKHSTSSEFGKLHNKERPPLVNFINVPISFEVV